MIRDLRRVRTFLMENPSEVVIIMLEQYVNTSDLVGLFYDAGLAPFLYNTTSSPTASNGTFAWPTFEDLGDAGTTLLVFNDEIPGGRLNLAPPPWMLYQWHFAVETMYGMASVEELATCELNRGRQSDDYLGSGRHMHDNMLLIHNVFLTAPVATPALADSVNHSPILNDIVARCRDGFFGGRAGVLVTVDFWSIGDVVVMT